MDESYDRQMLRAMSARDYSAMKTLLNLMWDSCEHCGNYPKMDDDYLCERCHRTAPGARRWGMKNE